jgi:hypothetical protein
MITTTNKQTNKKQTREKSIWSEEDIRETVRERDMEMGKTEGFEDRLYIPAIADRLSTL